MAVASGVVCVCIHHSSGTVYRELLVGSGKMLGGGGGGGGGGVVTVVVTTATLANASHES